MSEFRANEYDFFQFETRIRDLIKELMIPVQNDAE